MIRRLFGIVRMQIAVTFAYRGSVLFWVFLHVMNFAVMYFFWTAVFSDHQLIQGFTMEQMLQYVFITSIIREFVMVSPEYAVNGDINQGKLSTYLLRPISYPFHIILTSSLWHILQMLIGLFIYILIAIFLLPDLHFNISWQLMLTVLPLILLGHILCNLLSVTLGYIAFWLQQASAFFFYKDILILLASGLFFPKDLLPGWFQGIINFLPFYSFIGYPAEILTHKIQEIHILPYVSHLLIWIVICFILQLLVWNRGVKTYEAVGS